MSSTENVWSVTAFLNYLATANDVAIITASIAMIDDTDALFITGFGQGIVFTKKMDEGLINHNQCRSFDVWCVDYSTDLLSKLIFYANNFFLLLHTQETNCLEDSFYQFSNDLRQFTWVFISDEKSWNPLSVKYLTISDISQTMK